AGVGTAHLNQLVHRDLKPSNIFLANISGVEDIAKILDFGIAKPRDKITTKLTQDAMIVGSPGYISPEQITFSSEADSRSDIYALGAILYFMITGHAAYRGPSSQAVLARQLTEPPEPIDFNRLGKPGAEAFVPVVLKAMNLDPDQRYQSTAELMSALREAYSGGERQINAGEALPFKKDSTTGLKDSPSAERPMDSSLSALDIAPPPGKSRRSIIMAASAALLLLLGILGLVQSKGGISRMFSKRPQVQGISDTEISLGISAAFSGPSKELGRKMKLGIETSFRNINSNGGINGRKLSLVALDDGYEPNKALDNMKELLEKRKVFGIIGNVGTPTAQLAAPYAVEKKSLFFGALTGANILRKDPPD